MKGFFKCQVFKWIGFLFWERNMFGDGICLIWIDFSGDFRFKIMVVDCYCFIKYCISIVV